MKKQKSVLIGLSGGVDSSVAALLLKKQGYNVTAAFMKCFSETKNNLTGECAWLEERKIAQKIASILEIPFITLNFENKYKKLVIDKMFKDYKSGLTPNPDILCNSIIKFPLLWKEAKKRGFDYVATGHYAKIKKTSKGFQLLKGKDKEKDQSYFLSDINQNDLSHTLFPLANLTKQEVRKIAKLNKFPNWNKHGTAGICFVGNINMKKFLEQKIKNNPGKLLDSEKKVIGTHQGISYYTIGQRAVPHIGLDFKKPKESASLKWYISEKNNKENTIIIAPEGHNTLRKKTIKINKLHLINPKERMPLNLEARIRYRGKLYKGKLKNNKLFQSNKPIEAIAPGQIIVLYKKNQLLASGIISY